MGTMRGLSPATASQPALEEVGEQYEREDRLAEREPFLGESAQSLPRYASVDEIGPWIPETDPTHRRANTLSVKIAQRRTMLIIQAATASVFATATLGLMGWSIDRYPRMGDIGTFMTGSCSTVHRWDTIWHVVLNIASTLFLGAGNYSMQVLVAPSRNQVDKAHRRGVSLDVGIHSFGNVRKIPLVRKAIWLMLGVISTLLHLFWNSAIFSSIPFTEFPVAIATSDFEQAHDEWRTTFPIERSRDIFANASSIYALQHKASTFTRLNNSECIAAYIDPRKAAGELILVSSVPTAKNIRNGSILDGWISGSDPSQWQASTKWICSDLYPDPTWPLTCTKEWAMPHVDDWAVHENPIQYCLVGESADNNARCGLHFSMTIFLVVGVCLLVEAAIICFVAYMGKDPTMVTLGDAQAEFLARPDECTGLDSKPGKTSHRGYFARFEMSEWKPSSVFWFHAMGSYMWVMTITLILAALILGIVLFSQTVDAMHVRGLKANFSNLWSYGIGRTNLFGLVGGKALGGRQSSQHIIGHVLFVNLFQLIISFLYLFFNNCLTCQVVADQWTRFMTTSDGTTNRKPLRVSSHVGLQRPSYMLSLPWTYAAPLMLAFAALHILVARSVFIVRTTAFGPGPADQSQRIVGSDASRVGFSSMGILLATSTGAVLLCLLIANSCRRYPAVPEYLPRLAHKTAFISAACQRPDQDKDAHLFPVTFMAVQIDLDRSTDTSPSSIERIVFSSDRYSAAPEVGKRYVQPVPVETLDEWEWLWRFWEWMKTGWRWIGEKCRLLTTNASHVLAQFRRGRSRKT